MIDVRRSPELRDLIVAMAAAERRIRNGMVRAARRAANATWRPALQRRRVTRLQARVLLPGARTSVSARQVQLLAATRNRELRGGLQPSTEWHGAEFGSIRYRQFGGRFSTGKVVYPAARKVGPEVVAAWASGAVAGLLEGTDAETS